MAKRLDQIAILLVDDSLDSLELLKMFLELEGAEVRTAESANAAYAHLEDWVPDVLVSDINLPDEHGCSMLRTMRERFNWHARGAIALTGHADAATRTSATKAGFHHYVVKPVNLTDLTATVSRMVRSAAPQTANPL